MIETAEDIYEKTYCVSRDDPRKPAILDVRTFDKFYKEFAGRTPPEPMPDLTLEARIDWGRWIVDCPYCHGAMAAFIEEPSLFFCRKCKNDGTYKPIEVKFPNEKAEIETLLEKRPKANQNWRVGETLEFLKQENKERDV